MIITVRIRNNEQDGKISVSFFFQNTGLIVSHYAFFCSVARFLNNCETRKREALTTRSLYLISLKLTEKQPKTHKTDKVNNSIKYSAGQALRVSELNDPKSDPAEISFLHYSLSLCGVFTKSLALCRLHCLLYQEE